MNLWPGDKRRSPIKRIRVPVFKKFGCDDWQELEDLIDIANARGVISDDDAILLWHRFNWSDGRGGHTVARINTYHLIAEAMGLDESHVRRRIQSSLAKVGEWWGLTSPPRRVPVDR